MLSPSEITFASPVPAASVVPIPAGETGFHPRARAGDPSARTRGIGEPTLRRRVPAPGTETPHHHSHSSPVPGSPPARAVSPRPAAPLALPCAAKEARPIGRGRRAAVRPARRSSGSDHEVSRHGRLIRGPPEPDVAIMVHALSFLALLRAFRPVWMVPPALRRSQRQPKQTHKQSPE